MCAPGTASGRQHLADRDALDVEDQVRVGRDIGEGLVAVGQLGGDGEPALTTGRDALDTNVPALDDLADAELEGEWLALLVGCRLLAQAWQTKC